MLELLDPVELRLAGELGTEVPPRRLRARTGVPGARAFLESGQESAQELAAAFTATGQSLGRVESVLDFGCGPGRVLPHFAGLAPSAQCTGADVSPNAIAWARRHRPELRWEVSNFTPPLPFTDESFDLVYSVSVFSHLDEALQDRWLEEICRVLRPGGIGLLTVHGPHALEQFRSGQVQTRWSPRSAFDRASLAPGEFVFVPYERSIWIQAELPGVEGEFGLAFHGHQYVRDHWGRRLDIIDVRPRAMTAWQDIVVCRRAAASGGA